MNRLIPDETKVEVEKMKAGIAFPNLKAYSDISDLINALGTPHVLQKLSPLDLAERAVTLSVYSLALTAEESRIRSYVNWCEANLKYIVGKKLDAAPGYGFNEKDAYIRANEEMAQTIDENRLMAQAKLDQLSFIAQKIHYIADAIKNLAYEKNKYLKAP